jgi:hypothetical protein
MNKNNSDNFIDNLSQTEIPIKDILKDSCYYPSCGFDGQIVKYLSKEVQSFIYCDYGISEKEFLEQIDTFYGYKIISKRKVEEKDLTPDSWKPIFPPHLKLNEYYKYKEYIKKPYSYWIVYERLPEFDENHGAKRFSLLFICGEGVATYQALYWTHKLTAKVLAIIQPGTGFGLNWTDFYNENGALYWVIQNNPSGTPEFIYYGGVGQSYDDLKWDNYTKIKTIKPYYSSHESLDKKTHGKVTVWVKK